MSNFTPKFGKFSRHAAALAVTAGLALASGLAQAAPVQGTLGATSTGSVLITASVPNRARITKLNDINFVNQDPTIAATSTQDVCVWSNTATKQYTVTATGDGASSAFTLASGTLTAVPYSVQWAGSTGAASGTALATNTASAAFTSTATNQTCASGPSASASLIVGIGTSDLGTMQAATNYTGTLTLVVTPQ